LGYLSDAEIDSARVTRMILHLVGKRDAEFQPEPEIPVQEELFFRARILGEAGSAVHSFGPHSQVRPLLERMATGALGFEPGGQALAQLFWRDHVKQATSGAFFVFELRVADPDVVFYALIKYDYREAVELTQIDGRNVLRAIIQAFVKERKAIQKFCIARVRAGVADELVSAADRMEQAPDLTDYFERFLGVSRSRSTQELSARLNEVLRASLNELQDHLPGRDVGRAVAQAKLALQPLASVSNENLIDAVMHAAGRPDDEKVRATLERVVRRRLRAQNLDDVEFRPDARTLQLRPRRVVRTVEDVKLEYPDEELGRSVTRQEMSDGGFTFTIRTGKALVEDGTLPYRAAAGGDATTDGDGSNPPPRLPAA
jgi:hypothetical protein